jgi:hypothetical protein
LCALRPVVYFMRGVSHAYLFIICSVTLIIQNLKCIDLTYMYLISASKSKIFLYPSSTCSTQYSGIVVALRSGAPGLKSRSELRLC